MAQKVNIILVDDLDGGSADENVRFGLDGVSYEIDLSAANAAELRSSLERFVAARARRPPAAATRTKAAQACPQPMTLHRSASGPGITATRLTAAAEFRLKSRKPTKRQIPSTAARLA